MTNTNNTAAALSPLAAAKARAANRVALAEARRIADRPVYVFTKTASCGNHVSTVACVFCDSARVHHP